MRGDMPTPWGTSQTKVHIAPGVLWVTTAGHGGLLVGKAVARRCLSERTLRHVGFDWGSYVAFEEDVDYAAPLMDRADWARAWLRAMDPEHPKLALDDAALRAEFAKVVDRWHPEDKEGA